MSRSTDASHLRMVDDLRRHRCIQFVRPSTGRPMPWLLWRVFMDFLVAHPSAAQPPQP